MSASLFNRLRSSWRGTPRFDRGVLLLGGVSGLLYAAGALGGLALPQGLLGFLFLFLAVLAGFRWLGRHRARLLWSLRNRLIVAYLLIAVVPVLLLLIMAGLSAYLIYSQYSAHLFYSSLEQEEKKIVAAAEVLAAGLASGSVALPGDGAGPSQLSSLVELAKGELPGMEVRVNPQPDLTARGPHGQRFEGLVQSGGVLRYEAQVAQQGRQGRVVVAVSMPLTAALLDRLAPGLGPIQLTITRPAESDDPQAVVVNGRAVQSVGQISSRQRPLPEPDHWLDYEVRGLTTLEAVWLDASAPQVNPVIATFSSRPSLLNQRLFGSLGAFGDVASVILVVTGFIFLMIETVALVTGIRLTRSITSTIEELYDATQSVRAGDFSHRVRIQTRDQLGVLAESFNEMTGSISTLIERQRHSQRLEDEVAIAREVQSQLFPQRLPVVAGVELAAVCRAARMVSGDYFDFVQLSPTQVAMAIADISGKGISAALLMASVQAALRSQLLLDGARAPDTAGLTARLNQHLYVNTSEERYATLFLAVYDSATRTLRYTNAGHLPPVCLVGEKVVKLEEGGTVVGLFSDCAYEQGVLHVEPDSLLVAYSDGLVEPENVYGEEFGAGRLCDEILRHRQVSPQRLAESLVGVAEEWSGAGEQSDDMTVVVMRFR